VTIYLDQIPQFSASATGFKYNDNASTVFQGSIFFNLNPSDPFPVGQYEIIPGVNFKQPVNYQLATVSGTLEVLPEYLSLDSVIVTAVSCAGFADGSLEILATTEGGQIGYSMDGGATFNLSGHFESLPAGTYTVLVKIFGVPNIPVRTATITILEGPPAQTWYKDWDGDGYSDGTTLQACDQPEGYKSAATLRATSGDCNDTDANEQPNQLWFKDADGDGYSDGTTQNACQRPYGFFVLGELLGPSTDCNDANGDIFPYQEEVCNGQDEDCNGLIDDGIENMVYNGNVVFSNQAQVNAWSLCYSSINGNLTIQNASVDSLPTLINLRKVTGNVTIKSTGLDNLHGLDSLRKIGGFLLIQTNTSMTSLAGLSALDTVGAYLRIFQNLNLSQCCAIYDLINEENPKHIGGAITIFLNKTGCESIAKINTVCAGSNLLAPVTTAPTTTLPSLENAGALTASLSPNPASEEVRVQLIGHDGSPCELMIYDYLGRLVLAQRMEEGQYEMPIRFEGTMLQNGRHFVKIVTENGTATVQLMVLR
jgi:hypothetical protein